MNDSNVETFQQLDMLDNAIVRLKHSICDIEDLKKTGTIKTKSVLKDFDEYHFLAIKDWCDTIDEEIQWYLDTGEWHGAAGGYRIQSLASCFIKKVEGSQSCVTGLPIYELYDILKEQGYSILV